MGPKLRERIREWRGVLITAPSVAGVLIVLRLTGLLQLLEWAALDQFFRLRPSEPADPRITIVAIEESALKKVGWPIPDTVLAKLLLNLKKQQPRAIGLDLIRDLPVEPGHQKLVKVFESTPNLIGVEKVVDDPYYGAAIAPPPTLSRRERVGAVDLMVDADGKIRRGLLTLKDKNGKIVESLGVKLALIYLKAEGITLEMIDKSKGHLRLGKAVFSPFKKNDGGYVEADADGYQILLNFKGRGCSSTAVPCPFRMVSMMDVLEDRIPSELVRDRIVLIGSTAPSLKDLFFLPYSGNLITIFERTPGVVIHAHLISQILSAALEGRPLIKVWIDPVEWLWIFFWSCTGATLSWTLRAKRLTALALLLTSSSLIVATYAAFICGWWIPLVPPLLALAGSAIVITGYIANLEHEERQAVMNLFGRHVTPKIAEAVWRDRDQLLEKGQLVGQKMTATVLFTDLKGFSTIAETMPPEKLMSWLNEYMNAMAHIVLDHDGVIDKFIGDAVMALFGVPIARTTPEEIAADAIAAVSCALAMGATLRSLNQEWEARGQPTVAMRVGIATGQVVTGSLGSSQRLDYTAIGDSVNVAARLESFDKSLDGGVCRILIGEETYQCIQNKFPTKFIGSVQLKGREQPVKVYLVPID